MFNRPGQPPPQLFSATLPTQKPIVSYILLGINIVVFLGQTFTGGSANTANLIAWGANYAPLVTNGEFWRLLAANFLHIGSAHIFFNSWALYSLGPQVESLFSWRRFLAIYLLSGISGAVFSYLFTQGLSAGASTAIFGLFGALVVFFYKQRNILGGVSRQVLTNLGVTLLLNVFLGLAPGSRIDNWGHLGGFVGGAILAWFLCPSYQRTDPFEQAFGEILPNYRRPELANGDLTDTNSLSRNMFVIALFVVGLVALTALATQMQ
jgi:rhomboid protease GluP